MKPKLLIHTSGEIFNLTPEKIVYFMADGNYCNVHLTDGTEFLLSSQLGQLEHTISEQLSYTKHTFVRVGKSLIINADRVEHINIQKQTLVMESGTDDKVVLTASREALKKMMNLIIENNKKTIIRPVTINAPTPIRTEKQSMLRGSNETISDREIRVIVENDSIQFK